MSIRIGAFWNAQDESGRGSRARNEGSRTCTDQSGAKSTVRGFWVDLPSSAHRTCTDGVHTVRVSSSR
eukprot:4205794-Prymnesium_polylepis.1